MNYKSANSNRERIISLIGQSLKSSKKVVHDIVVLPKAENTRFVYDSHIKMRINKNWMATGFDHDFLYNESGIYKLIDGTTADDDLTVFAIIYDKEISTYTLEPISNLIANEEISFANSEDFLRSL